MDRGNEILDACQLLLKYQQRELRKLTKKKKSRKVRSMESIIPQKVIPFSPPPAGPPCPTIRILPPPPSFLPPPPPIPPDPPKVVTKSPVAVVKPFCAPPPPPIGKPPMPPPSGGPPPPPPPPPIGGFSLKGPVVMRRKTSKHAIEHDKPIETSSCRWDQIDDIKAKGTLFENINPGKLSEDLIKSIVTAFPKKETFNGSKSARNSTMEFGTMPHKKKLALSIVLKKNKISASEFCNRITSNPNPDICLEMLDGLLKNFPTNDELRGYELIESVEQFNGNIVDLFCWSVSRTPGIKFLIEVNLQRSEVSMDITRIKNSLNELNNALDSIISYYPQMSALLHLLLKIGNYLNQGSKSFGAAGFSFEDLHRLLSMTSEAGTKEMVLDMMLEHGGDKFTLSMQSLQDLRCVVSDGTKHNLDEVKSMLELDLDKVRKTMEHMNVVDFVTGTFKSKVLIDLKQIENQVKEEQVVVETISNKITSVYNSLVVPKDKKLAEFFTYFESVLILISSGLERLRRKKEKAEKMEKDAFNRNQGGRYSLRIQSTKKDDDTLTGFLENIDFRRSIVRRNSKKINGTLNNNISNMKSPVFNELQQRLQRVRISQSRLEIPEEVNNNY